MNVLEIKAEIFTLDTLNFTKNPANIAPTPHPENLHSRKIVRS